MLQKFCLSEVSGSQEMRGSMHSAFRYVYRIRTPILLLSLSTLFLLRAYAPAGRSQVLRTERYRCLSLFFSSPLLSNVRFSRFQSSVEPPRKAAYIYVYLYIGVFDLFFFRRGTYVRLRHLSKLGPK